MSQLNITKALEESGHQFSTTTQIKVNQGNRYGFRIDNIKLEEGSVEDAIIDNLVASPVGHFVMLDWGISNQFGVQQYVIEVSKRNGDFEKVQEVSPSGSQLGAQNYQYLDDKTRAYGYRVYRIRYIMEDGTVRYSNLVNVKIAHPIQPMSVFPNPFTRFCELVPRSEPREGSGWPTDRQ